MLFLRKEDLTGNYTCDDNKENEKSNMIKKYVIHILAVSALCYDDFDIPFLI